MLIFLILIGVIVYFFLNKTHFQSITKSFSKTEQNMTIDDKYNSKKVAEKKELNYLLEKINKIGYENLSQQEKDRLQELSKN